MSSVWAAGSAQAGALACHGLVEPGDLAFERGRLLREPSTLPPQRRELQFLGAHTILLREHCVVCGPASLPDPSDFVGHSGTLTGACRRRETPP